MNKQPVRLFEGDGKPFTPFWKVVDEEASESGQAEIQFYGPISEFSWWGDEVTPGLFKAELDRLGGKPVTVRIHSAGGDVFAASAIRAMMMDYPGVVTTRIDGLCASAATYVAMAGDTVKMQDSAFFMVHDPWSIVMGSADELKTAARVLETVKKGIVETYQGKTGLEASVLDRWMSKETWFTAQEAKAAGFVDEVISQASGSKGLKPLVGAENMGVANAVLDLENAPEVVKRLFTTESTESTEIFEISDEVREKLRGILMGDDGTWVDVAEEGGASETPEAEAEEGGAQSEGDPNEADADLADEGQEADGAAEEMDGSPLPAPVDEREVRSLRDYIEVFG
jgi:ATP-dependent Clp protease protease subunit